MAGHLTRVSERQLSLLREIADGKRVDSSLATVVYALRNRGLVTTPGAYRYESASITEAGRRLVVSGKLELPARETRVAVPAKVPAAAVPHERLVEGLRDGGGRMVVPDPPANERAGWRRLIFANQAPSALAEGMQLRYRGRDEGDLEIWLEAIASDAVVPEEPPAIPVPEQLRRPHPLIAAAKAARISTDGWVHTMRTSGCLHMSVHRSSRPRALLVMQAIVDESRRRGWEVKEIKESRSCDGGLGVFVGPHGFELTVIEEQKRVDHQLTATEQRQKDRGGYIYAPKYDCEPTGRLVVRHGHDSYGGALANDRVRWRVEDRLGRVIQFIEEAAQRAVEREIEHQKELRRREQVWHATRARAVARFAEKCKAGALDRQLAQLQRASQIEDYVEAMRSRLDLTPEQKDWLDWVETYGRASDPRYRDDIVPAVPEPGHEDLRPFMNGLNPYGPNLAW